MTTKIIFLFLLFANFACSSIDANLPVDRSNPIRVDDLSFTPCAKWNFSVPGQISNLSISESGKAILLSSSGEKNANGKIRLLDHMGKVLWSRTLKQPVKSQSISKDGRFIAISNYSDHLQFYTANGQLKWEANHFGKPVFIENDRDNKPKIVLINDDDSQPGHSHFVYDFKGKLLFDDTVERILKNADYPTNLEMSDAYVDRKTGKISLFFTGGIMIVVDSLGTILHKWRLPEPISAVTVSEDGLYYALTSNLLFALGSGSSDWLWKSRLPSHGDALAVVGDKIVVHANAQNEQWVAAYEKNTGKPEWFYSNNEPALVTPPFQTQRDVAIGFFDMRNNGRIQFFGLNQKGKALWAKNLFAPNGIFSMAAARPNVVIGYGAPKKGTVTYFKIAESCN